MVSFASTGAQPYDILILSNGPGELTTWVRPVVLELRQQIPQARISLVLSPCPHASGQEMKIAQDYIKVDRVQPADFFMTFLVTGQTEEAWDWAPRGVVLFLGGDQFFTLWIAWKLHYRAVVYAEQEPRWRMWINAFALRTEEMRRRYSGGFLMRRRWQPKMQVVGDLMVDGVASATYLPGIPVPGWSIPSFLTDSPTTRPPKTSKADLTLMPESTFPLEDNTVPEPIPEERAGASLLPRGWQRLGEKGRSHYQIGILPGSKPAKLSLGVPLGLAIADELRQLIPNVSFVIPVAPSQTPKSLASFAQPKTNRDMALVYGTSAVLEQTNVGAQFVTPFGTVVKLWTAFPAYSVLANCDLCITTVGANTAELARLGVPMLVLLPLNKLDAMRAWDGLLGVMVRLPGIGTPLATVINWFASRWVGLLAWPNIWAKREIVPELRGHLKPAHVAQQARDLLVDALKRHHMREQLRQLTGQTGAAHAVAKIVANQLAKAKPRSQRPSR